MRRCKDCLSRERQEQSFSLSIYRPYAGSIEVPVSREIFEALEALQRSQEKADRRERDHCWHLETTPITRIPMRAFPESPERILTKPNEKHVVWHAIALLAPKQRRRLLMRYYFGIPTRQIAQLEDRSIRAVEYCLRRAKKKLRQTLKELWREEFS